VGQDTCGTRSIIRSVQESFCACQHVFSSSHYVSHTFVDLLICVVTQQSFKLQLINKIDKERFCAYVQGKREKMNFSPNWNSRI